MKRILYLIFALSVALHAQEKSFDLLNALPQKTLAVVWCPSVDDVKTAFLKSDLYQLYQEEEVQQFLAPMMDKFGPEMQHEIGKELSKINRETGSNITLDTLLNAVKGQVTLAVTGVNPANRKIPINFAAAIEFSEEVRQIIERLVAPQTQEQKLQNVVVRRGPMPGCFVFEGNTLVVASSTELMDQLYGEKQGLRHSEQFANVYKRITPEGEVTTFACFLNTKEAWNFAKQAIPPHIDMMLERAAVYSMESIAFSSNFAGRNIHSYGFLHLPHGKEGFFKLFPHTKMDVVANAKKVPDTAMSFTCGNVDFAGFMQEVQNILRLLDPKGQMGLMQQYEQGLQMLKQNMNLDMEQFAKALHGVAAQASILPRRGLLPSSIAVYTVGDNDSLQNSLQSMANLLQLQIKSVERDGYTLNYFSAPLGKLGTNPFDPRNTMRNPMQMVVSSIANAFSGMAYVIHDGHFYFSDSAQALQRHMAWQKDAKNTLADDADFQESIKSVSSDSTGVLYLNQKTLVARWWNTAIQFLRIFEGVLKKEKIPFHSALLPSHDTLTRHLGRAVFEFGSNEDGLYFAHKGQLEVILMGAAVVGIGAAIAVPAILRGKPRQKRFEMKKPERKYDTKKEHHKKYDKK
ncbi:DUF3352 domain-containing protein [Candidatus Uabimicrobium amorphum]|uniref:Cyclic nucleotide-binding domain-containing protein n=1 Tax=Uabimicrobium amorphum TaxID=2596890 RepID=A0A5S9F771_UABAM|nr:DUF3352 domain-containing protein [Candidatus Uabimicrobium amorphum]BBM87873.1 hypothetical protein UABAM_06288 [Candidatus Uabimicrobium amorphum]